MTVAIDSSIVRARAGGRVSQRGRGWTYGIHGTVKDDLSAQRVCEYGKKPLNGLRRAKRTTQTCSPPLVAAKIILHDALTRDP